MSVTKITSNGIADDAVTAAKIPNDAVTLAKMAAGTAVSYTHLTLPTICSV